MKHCKKPLRHKKSQKGFKYKTGIRTSRSIYFISLRMCDFLEACDGGVLTGVEN